MEIYTEDQKTLASQFPQKQSQINKILCCMCGLPFEALNTKTNICLQCLVSSQDITEGITKSGIIGYCRQCHRYQKPPWMNCGRESKELLAICLKKIRGLQRVKLLDAAFIWTEEHCRRIKIKLTIQKEILTGVNIQETFVVEFEEHYTQCEDCKREFTPHTWSACVQARQHVNHKKTFYLLEQMILKHNAHENCLKVKEAPEGLDFYFKNKMQALTLIDFLGQFLPLRQKMAKQLISTDLRSNITNYKYCYSLTFPKVCKEDLVIIPDKLKNELGGCSQVLLCLKVSSYIRCYDPIKSIIIDINANQYFNFEKDIECIPFKGNEKHFMVVNVEHDFTKKEKKEEKEENKKSKIHKQVENFTIEVSRCSDWQNFTIKTHLPPNFNCGVTLLGYDLTSLNQAQFDLAKAPDIILVKKERKNRQERRRIWKLKRMDIEMQDENNFHKKSAKKNDNQYEEFLEDVENDRDIRQDMNLYADADGIKQRKEQNLTKKGNEKSNQRQPANRKLIKAKKREETKKLKKAKEEEEKQKVEETKEEEWEDLDDSEDDQAVKVAELLKDMKLDDSNDEQQNQTETNQQDMLINQFISQLEKVKIEGDSKGQEAKDQQKTAK